MPRPSRATRIYLPYGRGPGAQPPIRHRASNARRGRHKQRSRSHHLVFDPVIARQRIHVLLGVLVIGLFLIAFITRCHVRGC